MNENEDYYKILGVDRKATIEEIKKAYRKKSFATHPDRSKDNNATEEFQKITEAYDILGDANKRSTYDQGFGCGFIDNLHKNQGFPSDMFDFIRENLNGVGAFDFATEINNGNMKFFHVDGNSHVNYQEVMQRPRPIVKKVMISLQQAFTGCTLPLEIERWVYDGSVKKTEIETVYFSIPEGVDDNEIIILREKGNVISDNSKGDIKIFITLTNDTEFERRGLDLVYKKTITLKEALCGFTFSIKYLDERTFKIENRNGNVISSGYNKIIPGLGMVREKNDNDAAKSANKGNLVIVFTVTFPDKLTKEQTEKIEECFPE